MRLDKSFKQKGRKKSTIADSFAILSGGVSSKPLLVSVGPLLGNNAQIHCSMKNTLNPLLLRKESLLNPFLL